LLMVISQWLPGCLRLLQNKGTIGAKSAIIMERVLFYIPHGKKFLAL